MLNFSRKHAAQSVRASAPERTSHRAGVAKRRAIALAAAASLAAIGARNIASAATGTWSTNGNGNWSDPLNWGGSAAPNAVDDVADFNTVDLAANATVTLDLPVTLGGLIFGDTNTATAGSWAIAPPTTPDNALTLATSVGVPTVTVNALAANNVATLGVILAGSQGFAKEGAGTLVLTRTNSYTGDTAINGGTLQLGNGGASGSISAGNVLNNGTLIYNRNNADSVVGNITGTGSVIKNGTGVWTLSGTNTYAGTTTVDAGLVNFSAPAAYSGLAAGSITVAPGGAIQNGAASINDAVFLGKVNAASTGAFGITAADAATNFDFTAGTFAPYANMSIGAASGSTVTYTGTLTPAGGTYRLGGGGGALVYPAAIAGASNVVIGGTGGAGTVHFTGNNTYSGTTTINAGNTLNIGNGTAAGTLGTGAVTNDGTIDFSRPDNITFAGTMTGTGALQRRNTGATAATNLSITGNINLTGPLFINRNGTTGAAVDTVSVDGGTLIATGNNSSIQGGTGAGQLILNSGTLTLGTINTDNNDGALIRVNGGTFTAADIGLARIGGTTNPAFGNGFVVTGGTASVGILRVGRTTSNSWGIASFEGGTTTVSGAMTIGQTTNGGRGGAVRVQGTAVFNSTDTVDGIILGRTNGATTAQASQITFSGGIATVEKFKFGYDSTLLTGSATMNVSGSGLLYLGGGGMEKNSAAGHTATVNFSAGTIGAKANWAAAPGITYNITGTGATFKAADAADNPFDITINSAVVGAGTINKTGGGVLGFYGLNTYTGPTNVTAGVLAGKGSSLRGNIANAATVRFDEASGTSTFAGVISGAGTVEKTGPGTTVVNGGQTYTGATTVTQGVLAFAGSHATSGVTVNNGGSVGVSGAGGATFAALTLGSSAGDALTFKANDGTGLHTLNVTGANALVANGLTTVDVGTVGLASGTFTLIDYNGAIGGGGYGPGTFTLGALPPRTAGSLVHNTANTSIDVTLTSDAPRWNGTIDNKWDVNATANWKTDFSNTDTVFLTGDNVIFDHRATGSTDVSVVGTVQPATVTVNNPASKNYTIGGTGNIGGSAVLFKQGDGTLTLATTGNTFTGGTQLQAGTLVLYNENALPLAGTVNVSGGTLDLGGAPQDFTGSFIVSGGTVTFGAVEKEGSAFDVRSGAVTNSASLRGPVGLTKTTPGTFVIAGSSHTYTGATTVTEGTLQLGNGINDGNVPGNINNSGTVAFNPGNDGFVWSNQVIGLNAEVVKDGPRTMYFTNINEGNATVNGGTVILIGPGGASVSPRLGRGGRLTVNNGATVLLQGGQPLGLNTANLPPNFLLNAGSTMKADVNAEVSIYNGTFAGGILSAELDYLSFSLRGDYTTAADTASSMTVPGLVGLNNAVGFTLGANSSITIQADLTGDTSLGFTGPGTAILEGDNTGVTGGVSIGDGATVEVADTNRLGGTGAVTLNNGAIKTLAAITDAHEIRVTGGGTVNTNGFDSTFSGPTSQGGPFTKAGAGTLTLTGATGHTGATNVTGGTLVIGQSLTTSSAVSTSNDGVLSVTSNGTYNKFVNTGALAIADNSKIDLSDNKLLTTTSVGTFDGTAYTGVQGMVQRAYNFGAWDQPGLTTSQPNAGQNAGILSGTTTIGVATAEQVLFIGATDTAVFQGQTVTGATTIAMYTYAGDLNFDGLVDGADYGVIDNSVQFPGTDGYVNGDFNYDGVIDGADYGVIDNTIQLQGAQIPGVVFGAASASSSGGGLAGVTAVPEPSACGVAILASAALLRRRRRRGDDAQQ